MQLAIDVGNTNICFGIFQENKLLNVWRCETNKNAILKDNFEKFLDHLSTYQILPSAIEHIMVSCVVPSLLQALQGICRQSFTGKVWVIGESIVKMPHKALIDIPEEVGADLMANAWGAHSFYPNVAIIIDFGTATTLSMIDREGNFRGVVIATGLQVSLRALSQAAANIPEMSVIKPQSVLGTNTIDSVQSGIFWGYVSMIEGLITRLKQENFQNLLSDKSQVIATGGLSSLIAPSLSLIDFIDAGLTLKGLMAILDYNLQRT